MAATELPSSSRDPAEDRFERSHQRMLETLRMVDQQSQQDHPFLGLRPLRMAEATLQQYQASAGPWDRSVMHGMYGQELLRSGRTTAALEHMRQSIELIEGLGQQVPPDVRQQTYYLLAVAFLRDAETVNCVHCINGERCLFPVVGDGVHEDTTSGRAAVEYLEKSLTLNPQDLKARWLLNIAYMTLGEYPEQVPAEYLLPPTLFTGAESPVGEFTNVAQALKLDVLGCAGGVIVDDFDGDLDLDILFSSWETNASLRYFRNDRERGFTDATEQANLHGINGGLNLLQADYDNDGDLDVLVLRGGWLEDFGRHPKSLLRNDGQGRFLDVTFAVGLGDEFFPTQTAGWADYDLDGDLDLYVGNEGFPCQLFANDGSGNFRDVAVAAGVTGGGLTKGVAWGDIDNDGWPDLYLSNLPGANRLYRNQQDGTFVDVASDLGVEGPMNSFPVWFWDANNDGYQDLYVASYQAGIEHVAGDYLGRPATTEHDAFYFGSPAGTFEDRRQQLGYYRVTQPMGLNVGDIDNDGFLDCYLGTGYVDYEGLMPNLLFHNVRGERLEDITFSARVGHLQKGHGIAMADFDHDGDLDIVAVMGGWFSGDAFARAVFENPGTDGNWLAVRLVGEQSNRFGMGCRIRATLLDSDGHTQTLYRQMDSGGSFGANPLRLHLGLGSSEQVAELEVFWPASGLRQIVQAIPANQLIEIHEGQAGFRELPW